MKKKPAKKEAIECNICCSGFLIEPGDKRCGFCGNAVHSCELRLIEISDSPLYIDQSVPIKIQIGLKNTGMIPFEPGELEIML